jgi:hypothetical protein
MITTIRKTLAAALTTAALAGLGTTAGAAGRYCSQTAAALRRACGFEALDDHARATAVCLNLADATERAQCHDDAAEERREALRVCGDQLRGRRDACKSLGEARYDPPFDPATFDSDFTNLTNPNRYFPLAIGTLWTLQGGNELNTIQILNETKLIDGVTCIVARDQVLRNGELVEDTDDWFAMNKDGNVWYCGEEVKDYESFDGDNPKLPELVSIDGSFKAGRDGDKPGIIFQAMPAAGQSYLEEFSLGNAEDVTDVLSASYSFGVDPILDQFVPQALATALCAGDCVVTRNFSLLEPGVFAHKYYALDIGFFLEVNPDTGEVTQLTSCNLPRCGLIP